MFVLKNYNTGMSRKLFKAKQHHPFEVKGPLGESLGVSKSGLHMAFCAGTGVLPLLDLVAHVLYTAMGINDQIGVGEDCIGPDFRLKLYVSYRSPSEAVGLDLLRYVEAYLKKTNKPYFELAQVKIS